MRRSGTGAGALMAQRLTNNAGGLREGRPTAKLAGGFYAN